MLRISDARLDQIIAEDIPYIDLTSTVLGIDSQPGRIEYYTREACTLCGTEEVARIMEKLGLTVEWSLESGTQVEAGQSYLAATGRADAIHQAWKVCLNMFDHLSAVATKSKQMVDAAHAVNPSCEVLTTRKSMPGIKDLLTKAVMCGGAFPHRLGLSETVLVFDHHTEFIGGFDAFLEQLPQIRCRCIEKKLFVEAGVDEARKLVAAGVDGVQFDKVTPKELTALVPELKAIDPHVTLIAAGGINPGNAGAYAATGVDGLVTTALFTAKPVDMSVRITKL